MTFSLDLKKATENIKGDCDQVIRGTLFSVSSRIIKRTPVGNPDLWNDPAPPGYVGGSLRGAWQASVGAPKLQPNGRVDENGANTIGALSSTISNFNLGETFYLTNPLPYAYRVEYGWSSQAPQGMVRRTLSEAQTIIDGLAR